MNETKTFPNKLIFSRLVKAIRVIRGMILPFALLGLVSTTQAVTSATATTPKFRLSIKHDGVRASAGDETLRYSSLWDGGSNETAKVTIAQSGVTLVENLAGEGDQGWSVTSNGTYNLTHTTYTNGAVAAVLHATFVVTGKDVPFTADEVTLSGYSGKYDGEGHGIAVTAPEGATIRYACSVNGPYGANPSFTNVCDATTIWCEVTKAGYIPYTNSATVVISKREVTLTSGDGSKTYDGTALTNWTYTVGGDGFVAGEGVTCSYSGTQTLVGSSKNTFDYALTEGTRAGNYTITQVAGTLEVTPGTIGPGGGDEPGDGEVPVGGLSKFDTTAMYDGEGHTVDTNGIRAAFGEVMIGAFTVQYAIDDGVRGAPALPWRDEVPVFTNACVETVWYKVSNPNYEDFVHAARVTVTNRPVTVTSASGSWVYDTTAHTTNAVEVTIGGDDTVSGPRGARALPAYGLIGNDTIVVDGFPSITDVGSKPNAFDWAFGAGTLATNYCVTVVTGTLEVTARTIGDNDANWDIRLDKSPMYTGTEQAAPIIQVCYVKPDGNLDYIPYTLSDNTATDAGNYKVRITGTGNYTGSVEKDWSIMPRNVTLTSGTASWTYDGATHVADTVSVTGDGFVDGEGATYSGFPQVTHVADASEPTANIFTYTLNANTKPGNYEITTATGTVQMTPRAVTLTSPTKEKTYDGTALTFTGDEIAATLTDAGDDDGARALPDGETFTYGSLASITEAGQTSARFTIADGTARLSDYTITPVYGTLTVRKNATEITVTAKNGNWTYDGAVHTLHEYDATNLGTLLAGDALEVTFDEASAVTTPIDGAERNGVVPNTITSVRVLRNGTDDVSANYTLAWYPGTLTVTRRPVTLTSKSATKVYDGAALTAHEVEVGGDGFAGADDATYEYTGSQTEKGTSKNAFTYALKAGTNAAYYDITTVEGTLEVTAADISDATDADWNVVLGPSLTYTGIAQIQTVTSIAYKGLPLDYSVADNQQTDAGSYEMTITGQGNFTGTKKVAWTLAPKALTLTAGSGTKVYDGTALTVQTVTANGFVAGEGATYTCDGSIVPVGTAANSVATITWNANTKASNYTVTKVAGTLAVTPRAITVTSKDISKPYDGKPLALAASDITVANMVAGESLVYSEFASRTEAGQTSATFAYAAGAGTALANYTVTPVYGTITITKSATEIGVTAASQSWVYDGTTHSNRTYTATNLSTLQAGDELRVTFNDASVVTKPTDGPDGDGKVANVITEVKVVRNGQDDVTANYTVTAYPGVLEVTKRPVTVMVTGHTATNTYDAVEHTVSGYEATTTDELYDIAADTSFTGTDTAARTDVGVSSMGLSAADFANGNTNFDVTYSVTDGSITVEQADISNETCSIILGANPKYNGTVQTIDVTSVTYSSPRGARALPVTYTLAGENATHAGTYTLTVKGTGNFTGERSTAWQILKRQVTLTSGSASRAYNAQPLVNGTVTVTGDGFIGVEGATYSVTGSQTVAGTSKNSFTYTLKAGTQAGDYEITQVAGDLVVTKASYDMSKVAWNYSEPFTYDGTEKTVTVKGLPAGVTPVYTDNSAILAGRYTASVDWVYDEANYVAPSSLAPLTWQIDEATLDVTVEDYNAPFDGLRHGVKVVCDNPAIVVRYALAPQGPYSETQPLYYDVVGPVTNWVEVLAPNYVTVTNCATVTITRREVTEEMLAYSDEAFFFDGANTKRPDVVLAFTNALGAVVSTTNDYTRSYGDRLANGEFPVTIMGLNNFTGIVTKSFAVLKRPVAPPVIPSLSYNGRTQKPKIPADDRWTVIANPGGVDVGDYTNVVLRLTNTEDYRWKGLGEDESDWTGVFTIKRGANGWTVRPTIANWTAGETPSEPQLGTPRRGATSSVTYRVRGADPETATTTRPTRAGLYTARFIVDGTVNYVGTYADVDFEILPGSGEIKDHTETTEVPVPYTWLDAYLALFGDGTTTDASYEQAGNALGRNGVPLWTSYVAGLEPTDPTSKFTADITLDGDGNPVVTWSPDLTEAAEPRVYTLLGKEKLTDANWVPVTDANKAQMKFFKVKVEMK